MRSSLLAFIAGIFVGLLLALWWRMAQIKHLREHRCGPEYGYEVVSGSTGITETP